MQDTRTISQLLTAAGYGHRHDAGSQNTGCHEIYRLDTGDVIAYLYAGDAARLAESHDRWTS